jgi:hypothetical protein
MITLQVSLPDELVTNAIAAAMQQRLSLDAYIGQCLGGAEPIAPVAGSADPMQELAEKLFEAALEVPLEAKPYRLEELHKRLALGHWSDNSTGDRVRLGKAFKRLVDAQPSGGTQLEDGIQVKVTHIGETARHQTIYVTVRVG